MNNNFMQVGDTVPLTTSGTLTTYPPKPSCVCPDCGRCQTCGQPYPQTTASWYGSGNFPYTTYTSAVPALPPDGVFIGATDYRL